MSGDQIHAGDLAAVLPQFAAIPRETLLGQAPLPGSQRVFRTPEIQALAHRFGIAAAQASDACFEWNMQPLDRARVLDAMRESLAVPDAQIEIADLMTARVPPGRIEFPVNRLGTPATAEQRAPVLWRGDVVYGDGHRFAIWARVGITTTCRRLVAAQSLKTGVPIEASQLRVTTVTCFPSVGKGVPPLDEVVGMVAARPVIAGAELRPELLAAANDINRGDSVQVEVRSGAARLALTVRALTAGRSGDMISVRNPDTNKIFQARVTGKGTAFVQAGAMKGI